MHPSISHIQALYLYSFILFSAPKTPVFNNLIMIISTKAHRLCSRSLDMSSIVSICKTLTQKHRIMLHKKNEANRRSASSFSLCIYICTLFRFFHCHNLLAVIITAGLADSVRQLRLLALRACNNARHGKLPVCTARIASCF